MTNEEYFKQLGKEKFYIMTPTLDAANIMRKKVQSKID